MAKRNIEKHDVETPDEFEKAKFGIEESAMALDFIADSLYSDSIEAIIRELCCNAYDAHAEIGKEDEPFKVKLPNELNDKFYVRDYGVGMSREKVLTLYSTIFASDKTDTNEQTGTYGVGSKSPFAYTKQFQVTTYSPDGIKREYTAFKNEQGEAEIMETTPKEGVGTDEERGVKIEFPVENIDQRRFENKAKEVLKFFNTKPEVLGLNDDQLKLREPDVKGEDDSWFFYYDTDYNTKIRNHDSLVVSGNIAYPIDFNQLDEKYTTRKFGNFILWMDINEVFPSNNRENLQYIDITVKNLEEKFDEIEEAITNKIKQEIKSENTFTDAWVKYLKYKNQKFGGNISMAPKFDGRQIPSSKAANINVFDYGDEVRRYNDGSYETVSKKKPRYKRDGNFSVTYIDRKFGGDYEVLEDVIGNITVVFADQDYGKRTRTKYYSEQNPDEIVYLVDADGQNDGKDKLDKFLDKLHFTDDYMVVSEMESSDSSRNKATNKGNADILKMDFTVGYGPSAKRKWKLIDENDLPDFAYYIYINRYQMNDKPVKGNSNYSDIKGYHKALLLLHEESNHREVGDYGGLQTPIYGVKRRAKNKVPDNWKLLDRETLEEWCTWLVNQYKEDIEKHKASVHDKATKVQRNDKSLCSSVQDPLVEKAFDTWEEEKKLGLDTDEKVLNKLEKFILPYCRHNIDLDIESKCRGQKAAEILDEIEDRYPLLVSSGWQSYLKLGRLENENYLEYVNALYKQKYKEDDEDENDQ